MVILVARHRVKDVEHWLNGYKSPAAKAVRERMGVIAETAYVSIQEDNQVMVVHHFQTQTALQAFLDLPEFKAGLKELGVLEPIELKQYTELE